LKGFTVGETNMDVEIPAINDDLDVAMRIKCGDETAFHRVISQHQQHVLSLALRLSGNKEDAEEIVQDVFVTLFRKIGEFEGRCALGSWIHRITVNCALMKLRARRRKKRGDCSGLEFDFDSVDTSSSIDEVLMSRESLEIMREVINTLPDKFRVIFLLREVDGLSGQETALELGMTAAAVKSRLHRARDMVRRRYAVKNGMPSVAVLDDVVSQDCGTC